VSKGRILWCFSPKLNKYGEIRRTFISNSLKPPKKRRCARAKLAPLTTYWQALYRFQNAAICACVVTAPLEWTGMCNIIIIIIENCVECTLFCLFGRVLSPIPSTLRPASIQQPCTTSQLQLFLASVESHMLLSSIILHQAWLETSGVGCTKYWLRYCLYPIKTSVSGGDLTTDIFDWIL
jgi:hypothetical protein